MALSDHMKVVNLEQKSDEWLQWRSTGIGASEASAIMGCSPWDTPQTLWELKTGRRAPKPMNPAMLKGVELEDSVLEAYCQETGQLMMPMCGESAIHSFIKASFDGINMEGDRSVEIKVSGSTFRYVKEQGKAPEHYIVQVQHQMFVAGTVESDFIVLDPTVPEDRPFDERFAMITIPRDQAFIDQMVFKEWEFYNNICSDTPPASDEFLVRAEMYRRAEQEAKAAKKIADDLKQALIELVPEDMNRYSGGGVLVSRFNKSGSVDWSKLAKEEGISPEVQELYRKPATSQIKVTVQEELVVGVKGDE